jgi:AMP phosphorylase
MKGKVTVIRIETGGPLMVSLPHKIAKELDLHPMDRVKIKKGRRSAMVIVNFWARKITKKYHEIGVFEEVAKEMHLKDGDVVEIEPMPKPVSISYILEKMDGEELDQKQIFSIINDVVENRLSEVEIAAFISGVYINGTTVEEDFFLTKAIAETGGMIKFKGKVADKHSTGGANPGRTTMILVPIIAACGYKIPKTSSRAITSAAGTADVMEVLADVNFSATQIKRIISKVGGCIVWGGGVNIASADDKMIRIRNPLRLDPKGLLISSVLAKKFAMGATHVVFDIPVGKETKIKTQHEAKELKLDFMKIGEKLNIKIDVVITDGNEPIGKGIGPALEAIDVIKVLNNSPDAPNDLREKSLLVTTKLLHLLGEKNPRSKAEDVLYSGKAWKKMQQIIKIQGGNPNITPENIKISKIKKDIVAYKSGRLIDTENLLLSRIARIAGAPRNKMAGIFLHKKLGEYVKKGEPLATVYAGSTGKLERAFSVPKLWKCEVEDLFKID